MTCKKPGGTSHFKILKQRNLTRWLLSVKHIIKIIHKGDQANQEAMSKTKELVWSSQVMDQWMNEKEKIFNSLLED